MMAVEPRSVTLPKTHLHAETSHQARTPWPRSSSFRRCPKTRQHQPSRRCWTMGS